MEMAGDYPDIIVGCVGGGSNFGGMILPWLRDKISGAKPDMRIIAVEPQAAPSLTRGPYAYDFGDVAGLTPLLKMYTLGHEFMPAPVHAGGLRYHGMAPIISHLYRLGLIEATAVPQTATFEAGIQFARTEGILSAPEATHALKIAVDEALKCKESGESKNILICLSGHGLFDLPAYGEYLSGRLKDYAFSDDDMKKALANLPKVN
jgi:tryptophan synthase beta chain